MIAIPPTKPNTWHERHEWTRYATTLFRYYSRRSNYTLRLETNPNMIAAVDPENRVVTLNPHFTEPEKHSPVRHNTNDPHEHVTNSLKGYLAHEAGHVRFSADKPAGLLGHIWNSIEDERIERILAQQHPHLKPIFDYIGDIHLTRGWKNLTSTPLEGVLVWRWSHDHPTLNWQSNDPDKWAQIQPLVEAAWAEPDPHEVQRHAQLILDALELPEHHELPPIMKSELLSSPPQPRPSNGQTTSPTPGDSSNEQQPHAGGTPEPGDPSEDEPADNSAPPPKAPPVLPEAPDQVAARQLLDEVEGHARDLAAALAMPNAPALKQNHRTRGRFNYARYATGAEKAFQHKPTSTHHKRMPRITLLHDVSISMGSTSNPQDAQHHAVRATMLLHRAAQLSRTPINIITFHNQPDQLSHENDDAEQTQGRIASITSVGGTNLNPALQLALTQPTTRNEQHLIIIYCDGELLTHDANQCQELINTHPNAFILPVLIGTAPNASEFQRVFNRHLNVTSFQELPTSIKNWLAAHLN